MTLLFFGSPITFSDSAHAADPFPASLTSIEAGVSAFGYDGLGTPDTGPFQEFNSEQASGFTRFDESVHGEDGFQDCSDQDCGFADTSQTTDVLSGGDAFVGVKSIGGGQVSHTSDGEGQSDAQGEAISVLELTFNVSAASVPYQLQGEIATTATATNAECSSVTVNASWTTPIVVGAPSSECIGNPPNDLTIDLTGTVPQGQHTFRITMGAITQAVTGDATDGEATASYDIALHLCSVLGTENEDILNGTNGDDVICGLGGDDILGGLAGSNGNDTIVGGPGDDLMFGGAGTDTLAGGDDEDVLNGGDDDDTLLGDAGIDRIRGDGGNDEIHGGPGDDSAPSGENPNDWGLRGGDGVDTISGDEGVDLVVGDNDPDQLDGGVGKDIVLGEAGADNVLGGADDDFVHGGDDADIMRGGPGNDFVSGENGDDTLLGDAGDDVLHGDFFDQDIGRDRLEGGRGSDKLLGGPERDCLIGGTRKDVMKGEGGRDTILARDGVHDVVKGGPGNDRGRFDDGVDDVNGVENLAYEGGCN